jgi:hypothetical protein
MGAPLASAELLSGALLVTLPNRGRENTAYLHHVINNYELLADVTVFSHAGMPNGGLRSASGGGHMLAGTTFFDYAAATPDDGFFQLSTAMSMESLKRVRRRNGMEGGADRLRCHDEITAAGRSSSTCFDEAEAHELPSSPIFSHHVAKRCAQERASVCSLGAYWDTYGLGPRPPSNVLFYSQGARFAVTRAQLRRRPRAFYEALLASVNATQDPSAGYFLECMWFYVMTSPNNAPPCAIPSYVQY